MSVYWQAGEHIGHGLYLELEDDVRGRPRWLLRRRQPGRTAQRRRLSTRAAQNLLAAFVRERSGCGEGEALRAAAKLMLREMARWNSPRVAGRSKSGGPLSPA